MFNRSFAQNGRAAILAVLGLNAIIAASAATTKPNIVFVLTDDQDLALNGMFPMQQVAALVGGQRGATFTNAFTSSPICCPSRASILTGKYAHNHKTTNNSIEGGCNGQHWRAVEEQQTLPVLFEAGGYETFYAGKYLNQYRGASVPPGWRHFYGLHGNSRYYNYTLRENAHNVSYGDVYLTDLLRDKALQFLDEREDASKPFFAMISPPACHAPFTPAERHKDKFKGVKAMRTPNFNTIPEPLEKHWLVSDTWTIPSNVLSTMDAYYRQRWETLLSVDELVAAIVDKLEQQHLLNNTYIIYTSDNGYHIGQFAQPFDKRQPYETDIKVPLLIRGPGVPPGVQVHLPTTLIDLMPTMLEWASLPIRQDLDGESFNAYLANAAGYDVMLDKKYQRGILVQYWGEGNDNTYNAECPWAVRDHLAECTLDSDCHCQDAANNTYACIRHFRHEINRLYCEFRDEENFVEAYDLNADPHQMSNLGYELLPIERAFYSLALRNLTRCSGESCRDVSI